MSGVALRCPQCGTTRATPGECDACHEAQVRYYCSNHRPGRWLDGATCTQCGARFGDAAVPARLAAPVAPPPRPTPGSRPAPRPPASHDRPAEAPSRRAGPGSARPLPPRGAPSPRAFGLEDLLREAARSRRPSPAPMDDERAAAPRRGAGGCLLRLVMLAVFFVLLLVGGLFVFGGMLLQMFQPY